MILCKSGPRFSTVIEVELLNEFVRVLVRQTWDCWIRPRPTVESSSSCHGKSQQWQVGDALIHDKAVKCRGLADRISHLLTVNIELIINFEIAEY